MSSITPRITAQMYRTLDVSREMLTAIIYRDTDLERDLLWYLCKRGSRIRGASIARAFVSAYFMKTHQSLSDDPDCYVMQLDKPMIVKRLGSLARAGLVDSRSGRNGGYLFKPNWFRMCLRQSNAYSESRA